MGKQYRGFQVSSPDSFSVTIAGKEFTYNTEAECVRLINMWAGLTSVDDALYADLRFVATEALKVDSSRKNKNKGDAMTIQMLQSGDCDVIVDGDDIKVSDGSGLLATIPNDGSTPVIYILGTDGDDRLSINIADVEYNSEFDFDGKGGTDSVIIHWDDPGSPDFDSAGEAAGDVDHDGLIVNWRNCE